MNCLLDAYGSAVGWGMAKQWNGMYVWPEPFNARAVFRILFFCRSRPGYNEETSNKISPFP